MVKQILNFVDDHYVSRASGKTFVQSKLDAGGKLVGERAPTTTSAASRSRQPASTRPGRPATIMLHPHPPRSMINLRYVALWSTAQWTCWMHAARVSASPTQM